MKPDRGSVVPWVIALVVTGVMLAALLGGLGQGLMARGRATVAADAAALAAAAVTFRPFGSDGDPAQEASRFANAHGAVLTGCACPIDTSYSVRQVEVTVRVTVDVLGMGVRSFDATSRAEFDPVQLLGEWRSN